MTPRDTERVFGPSYLWDFACDGAVCGSRCCRGWRVPVDEAARQRFRDAAPAFGAELDEGLFEGADGWETRRTEAGDCAFLDPDGLCRLQKRRGEALLPDICDSYPRAAYRFSGFTERSLTLSCPLAARLALLPRAPMRFEERLVPARRASCVVQPPAEALRREALIRPLQLRMIAILQDRSLPLRRRFLVLGEFLSRLDARIHEEPPGEALFALCEAEGREHDAAVPRAPAFMRLRYMASLVAAIYEAEDNFPAARIDELAHRLEAYEARVEASLHGRLGHILENFAVNELFLRLYPFACAGGFPANFRLFALRFRIAEFTLLLSAAKGDTEEADALSMLGCITEKLDHNRFANELLKRHAREDFGKRSAAEFLALL